MRLALERDNARPCQQPNRSSVSSYNKLRIKYLIKKKKGKGNYSAVTGRSEGFDHSTFSAGQDVTASAHSATD